MQCEEVSRRLRKRFIVIFDRPVTVVSHALKFIPIRIGNGCPLGSIALISLQTIETFGCIRKPWAFERRTGVHSYRQQ